MTAGFFLVLEGPEGAGKTTLTAALAARLHAAGHEPVVVREPGGTPAAEALRQVLLQSSGHLPPEQELLFMTAARADLVRCTIRPALERGAVVVSDRYDLSTLAYQGAGRGIAPERIRWINGVATGGLRPDLTLVLDLPPELGMARQESSGKLRDRLDREPLEFHRRVAERYRAETGPGVVHLDATVPADALAEAAWTAIVAARPSLISAPATR